MKCFANRLKAGNFLLPAFLFTSLNALLVSCDPRGIDDLYLGGSFQVKAKVLNAQDSLTLGDSLKVIFEIPDTINLQSSIVYNAAGSGTQIILTDKTNCEMGEAVRIADSTVTGGVNTPLAFNWCRLYANPGHFVNNGIRLVKNGNRFFAVYYLIPSRKGVFYLASSGIGGYFEGNSTAGKIKCRIVFDFDVTDKHYNLLRTAIGQTNNIDPMIQEMALHGQGLYAFAVK